MRTVWLSLVVLSAGVCTHTTRAQDSPATSQPTPVNVVIHLIDTLRADRIGAYGFHDRPTSPTIDALARESVLFERASAAAPWTLPSVVSLLTSTFSCEHRVVHDRRRLTPSLIPLPERLRNVGYTTINLYSNSYVGRHFGMDRGYDLARFCPKIARKEVNAALMQMQGRPFFLYVHAMEVHHPHIFAPQHVRGFRSIPQSTRDEISQHYRAYRRLSRAAYDKKQPAGTIDNTAGQERELAALTALGDDYRELYDCAISASDARLKRVIEALKERGEWDNTLFILLADHGEEMNEHGGWLHDQSVYEELVHVPLIIHFPRGQYGGKRLHSVVSLVDVVPTIADYLNRESVGENARGRSLMKLIRGDESDDADDFIVTSMRQNRKKYYRPWKEARGDDNLVIRRGRWKGIWNIEPDTFELYDLDTDPGEHSDLSSTQDDLVLAMRAYARLWLKECYRVRAKAIEKNDDLDDRTRQNLRKLGYVN